VGPLPNIGLVFGMVFLAVGIAFKCSAVPFHMWTPDVYEGAPTPVTAFFAAAPKIAALALFMRVLTGPFGHLVGEWQQIIWALSAASMVLGALAAISQRNIKRLMAYSSINNVGYALIGLAAGTAEGIQGVLVYLSIYMFMTLGVFAVILSMERKGVYVEAIEDLAGLSKTRPLVAAAMLIFMFSMAGIPPFAGFLGKLAVFIPAIHAGLPTLAILGVVTSVPGAYYYLRIVKVMYFDEVKAPLDAKGGAGSVGLVMALAAILIVVTLVVPSGLYQAAGAAAQSLFGG
jgi:NADH-quinone oxidoreductase subunit N